MEFSSRAPKVKRNKPPRISKHQMVKNTPVKDFEGLCKYMQNLSHAKLREMQRYATSSVNQQEIVDAICSNKAVVIKQDKNAITAVVRHINRYYVAVMDKEVKVIKTFLPDSINNFLEYVQMLIDKENLNQYAIAA